VLSVPAFASPSHALHADRFRVTWWEDVPVGVGMAADRKQREARTRANMDPVRGGRRLPTRVVERLARERGLPTDAQERRTLLKRVRKASGRRRGRSAPPRQTRRVQRTQDVCANRLLPWTLDLSLCIALRTKGAWPDYREQLRRWPQVRAPYYRAHDKILRPRLRCPDVAGGLAWMDVWPGMCWWRKEERPDDMFFLLDVLEPVISERAEEGDAWELPAMDVATVRSARDVAQYVRWLASVQKRVSSQDRRVWRPDRTCAVVQFSAAAMRRVDSRSGLPTRYGTCLASWFNNATPCDVEQWVYNDAGWLVRKRRWRPYWCDDDSGVQARPTVAFADEPLRWTCRQSQFQRGCRGWFDQFPAHALLLGVDPAWARLMVRYGGVPDDLVVHVKGLGLDKAEWGEFSTKSQMCMWYAFNLSTDVTRWPSHVVTAVHEGSHDCKKVPAKWIADMFGEDFEDGAAVMEWPAVHDAPSASPAEAESFVARKVAGDGVYANDVKFQAAGFPPDDWYTVKGNTAHMVVPAFVNGDLMDKRRHMRRTGGNAAYLSDWLSWRHKFEPFSKHRPPSHEPGQFVSDSHVDLFETRVALWRERGWIVGKRQYERLRNLLVAVSGGRVHVRDGGGFSRLGSQQLGMVSECAHAVSTNATKAFVDEQRDLNVELGVSKVVFDHLLSCVDSPPGFSRTAHLQLLAQRGKYKMSKGDVMLFNTLLVSWHLLRALRPRTASVRRAMNVCLALRGLVHFVFNRMWYCTLATHRYLVSAAFRQLWAHLHTLAREEWPWLFTPNAKALETCFLTSILVMPVVRVQDCRAIEAMHVPFIQVRDSLPRAPESVCGRTTRLGSGRVARWTSPCGARRFARVCSRGSTATFRRTSAIATRGCSRTMCCGSDRTET